MATDRAFMLYVAEQIDLGSRLTYRKMFGEYALYLDEKVVAFVCDNSLFIKPSPAAATLAPDLLQAPLSRRQGLSGGRRTAGRCRRAAPSRD